MTSVAGLTLTDEITHEICEWVMSGRPLAEYCATAGKPSLNTINNWRHTNDIFAKRFSQARDIGFDSIAERLRTTVRGGDGSTLDWKRDRLVAETELKLLAAWAPKRYGARIEAEHNLGNMDVSELSSRVCALLDKAMQSIFNAPPAKASDVEARMAEKPTAQVPEDAEFLTDAQRKALATTPPYPERKAPKRASKAEARKALQTPDTPPPEGTEDRW